MTTSTIAQNLQRIRERIAQAAAGAGRSPSDISLVAVTKKVGLSALREAIREGVTIFGESYVQEAHEKIPHIVGPVQWHFIGHLQRNKAKHAVTLFEMIHSVDSPALARDLNRIAAQHGKRMRVLIEINVSGEKTKSGIDPAGAPDLVSAIAALPNLSLEGLMTMPPYSEDPEKSRPYFKALRMLKDSLNEKYRGTVTLTELSMGMSSDFEVAIEEGATFVRIGTAIFGERA